jgi:hypothetical protein
VADESAHKAQRKVWMIPQLGGHAVAHGCGRFQRHERDCE